MRGRPVLEWMAFLAVWALLLPALWRMSSARALTPTPAPVSVAPAEAGVQSAWVRIRFSETPLRFTLYSHEAAVWSEDPAEADLEQPLEIAWTDSGPALKLEADWAQPGWRAIEVGVVTLDGRRARATVWSRGENVREWLVFP